MTVIVCLDNANGMMFNHRRQSRDANVVKDILKTINGASLLIAPYQLRKQEHQNDFLKYSKKI